MAISRSQLVKELEPGLNALFGLEYARYDQEWKGIFDVESSDRAFEEEVELSGFGNAPVKAEGAGIQYDDATEAHTSRYSHETIALAFAITEEAVEDNLYDRLSSRYTKALARSMANAKEIKGANVLNRAFNSSYTGGDGLELCSTAHLTVSGGNYKNELSTAADLNETSLEQALIDIAGLIDNRGLKIAVKAAKMIIPVNLQFVAEKIDDAKREFRHLQSLLDECTNVVDRMAIVRLDERGIRTNGYLVTGHVGEKCDACMIIHGYQDVSTDGKWPLSASFYSNSFLHEGGGVYDLTNLATAFDADGGGHANACGCRIQPLSETGLLEERAVVATDVERNIGAWLETWSSRSGQ